MSYYRDSKSRGNLYAYRPSRVFSGGATRQPSQVVRVATGEVDWAGLEALVDRIGAHLGADSSSLRVTATDSDGSVSGQSIAAVHRKLSADGTVPYSIRAAIYGRSRRCNAVVTYEAPAGRDGALEVLIEGHDDVDVLGLAEAIRRAVQRGQISGASLDAGFVEYDVTHTEVPSVPRRWRGAFRWLWAVSILLLGVSFVLEGGLQALAAGLAVSLIAGLIVAQATLR